MANDFLKALAIVSIMIVVGIVLAIIGIQHEHLTKLRDRKAELEIMLQDRDKKIVELEKQIKQLKEQNSELEKELMKYDKKRRKEKKE